jgi:hypothetical protein
MKARLVEDKQHFERGRNIRSSLDIGGINLKPLYNDRADNLKGEVKDLIQNANADWNEFLRKTFIGKTVTATFRKHAKINVNGKMTGSTEVKEFTFKVDDVLVSASEEAESITTSIVFSDGQEIYTLTHMDTKIYVE